MLPYERFVARHGEVAAQAIIEYLERHESVRALSALSLEERWKKLMQDKETSSVAAP